MDVESLPQNVALARELADNSDYNSALTYYEMALSFMAKCVRLCVSECRRGAGCTPRCMRTRDACVRISTGHGGQARSLPTPPNRHVRVVTEAYTLAKWQDCRKRVAQEAELCKDILAETAAIRANQPHAPSYGPSSSSRQQQQHRHMVGWAGGWAVPSQNASACAGLPLAPWRGMLMQGDGAVTGVPRTRYCIHPLAARGAL